MPTFTYTIEDAEEYTVNGDGTAVELMLSLRYTTKDTDGTTYESSDQLVIPLQKHAEEGFMKPRPDLAGKTVTISISD